MTPVERWAELKALQEAYPTFDTFLYDVINGLMGFDCTANQIDMGNYLQYGPQYRMIQAQRGQAKTTVTAAYAVWRLIHTPSDRILIISSGDKMAKEISGWVIQIITGMEELSCMLPDKAHGDRSSIEAYDVHYELKGPEKSPSVACVGITANLQGKRADVLIADDIESQKNSLTAEMREKIIHLSRDFTSICSKGDIIYLGTPQSIDSIYNGLPGRGFGIRIWPGRYPTVEEEENYGAYLAPMIKKAMTDNPSLRTGGGMMGTRGQPTDHVILGEDVLVKKELDQGAAYFQLQHMLDTRLSDLARFPLKIERIIFMHVPPTSAPIHIHSNQSPENRIILPSDYPVKSKFFRASNFGREYGAYQGVHMYIDPAGGGENGDETAYAVTRFSSGKIFLVAVGGVPGGLGQEAMDLLTEVAVKFKPFKITIEENYGKGALSSTLQPILFRAHSCEIEDVWESGQKELRIIDTMEPLIGAGRFIVDEELIDEDWAACQQYPTDKKASFSLFQQISKITRDRGSLIHEDRLDAVAGTCRNWLEDLKQDEDHAAAVAQRKKYEQMMQNPLGNRSGTPAGFSSMVRGGSTINNSLASLKRRW